MEIRFFLIVFFLIGLFDPVSSYSQQDLKGLDGSITDNEKNAARIIASDENNQIFINNSEDYYKISIRSKKLAVASLCICDGTRVMVLHASAALAKVDYKKKSAGDWETSQSFNWEMRQEEMDEKTIDLRQKYLDKNGWVATTMGMGNETDVEFILSKSLLMGKNAALAVGLMPESNPGNIIALPEDKGCGALSLVSGDSGTSYSFNTSNWYELLK